jgi:hypothetical protein
MAQPFVIDGFWHPYEFPQENLRGRFGRVFNDVLYAFHPLIKPPEPMLNERERQHDWQDDEFVATMLLESDTEIVCVRSVPMLAKVGTVSTACRRTKGAPT